MSHLHRQIAANAHMAAQAGNPEEAGVFLAEPVLPAVEVEVPAEAPATEVPALVPVTP